MTNHTILSYLTPTSGGGSNGSAPIQLAENNVSRSIFLTCYIVVAVAGLFGNLMTCYAIARHRHLRKAVHWYTLNMAIADLLVILFYVPVEVIKNEHNMKWTMGEPLCRFNYCVIPTALVASIYTLVAITVDRHRAITKPLRWRSDPASIVKITIPIIWFFSIVLSIPLMVVVTVGEFPPGSGSYFCYEQWRTVRSERAYWITMFSAQVLVPMCIMISLNLHISKVLTKYQLRDRDYHKKIIRMTVALVAIYVVCSCPQHIFFFCHSFGNFNFVSLGVQKALFKVSNLLLILQMALNPVIYGTLGDLKRSFRMIFQRMKFAIAESFTKRRWGLRTTSNEVIAESEHLKSKGLNETVR